MRAVYDLIRRVGPSKASVLITGETGTGKELAARALHNASPRRNKLFVPINCAAIPAEILESELFGYEKGAFTGAVKDRVGKFELADGGTMFLDELAEMPIALQAKLLRVLQESTIERLGSNRSISLDIRVIAATNRDPSAVVRDGKFREDLYYRINVFALALPSLRERVEDIAGLVEHFVAQAWRFARAGAVAREHLAIPGAIRLARQRAGAGEHDRTGADSEWRCSFERGTFPAAAAHHCRPRRAFNGIICASTD